MALTAIPVGFIAGLFGIGGGLITVPFLYYIFGSLEVDKLYLMHLAVGTSFAIIIPTSIVSVLTHHKFKAVDFDIVKNYGIFVVVGVIVGTIFAAILKNRIEKGIDHLIQKAQFRFRKKTEAQLRQAKEAAAQ